MQVLRYSNLDQLVPLAGDWDRLTRAVPFRSWAWTTTWWRHYGTLKEGPAGRQLFVLGVRDEGDRLVGLAPWFVHRSASHGNVVRFLGTGEVCTDYLSVLCESDKLDAVAAALADWLTRAANGPGPDRWDLLCWEGVDAEDQAVRRVSDEFAQRGHTIHSRPGPNCWRIELPASWEEHLAALSKDHRKQLRRTERDYVATGRAVLHTVAGKRDLETALPILIDLHQRRRQELGEPGCYRSRRFAAFHPDVMPQLLENGQLQLHWIELDGRPAAAEYHLAGGGVVYAYQAGIEPDLLEHAPGRLANMMTIRRAIEMGYRAFDFLRGDEPYKAHWRAQPRAGIELRVVPNRVSARLRHTVWLAGVGMKRWLKSGLRPATSNKQDKRTH
ncbi:MAG: GNAT family N-acetyltransferase [Pirellulales bacterium]|nr:GNAT family N-acetyltransferase [Pirellulales bacterium]